MRSCQRRRRAERDREVIRPKATYDVRRRIAKDCLHIGRIRADVGNPVHRHSDRTGLRIERDDLPAFAIEDARGLSDIAHCAGDGDFGLSMYPEGAQAQGDEGEDGFHGGLSVGVIGGACQITTPAG